MMIHHQPLLQKKGSRLFENISEVRSEENNNNGDKCLQCSASSLDSNQDKNISLHVVFKSTERRWRPPRIPLRQEQWVLCLHKHMGNKNQRNLLRRPHGRQPRVGQQPGILAGKVRRTRGVLDNPYPQGREVRQSRCVQESMPERTRKHIERSRRLRRGEEQQAIGHRLRNGNNDLHEVLFRVIQSHLRVTNGLDGANQDREVTVPGGLRRNENDQLDKNKK